MADKAKTARKLEHLAIIMDGNGRWAKKNGLSRKEGHQAGEAAVRRVTDLCREYGIHYLTLYAFSTENWNRSTQEVGDLMELLGNSIDRNLAELNEKGIRILLSGRIEGLPLLTRRKLRKAVEKTANNTDGNLIIALNYGGRAEITDAAKKIAAAVKDGRISLKEIDENTFAEHLYLPEIPDPDLMIRTSGEHRISNFLLWQLSYCELYFTPIFWPDFNRDELEKAIKTFETRKRRYGGR